MKGTVAQNKASLMRWRQKNKNHFQELSRKYARTSYKRMCECSFERITKSFRKIDNFYFKK